MDPLNYLHPNTNSHFSSERNLKSRMIEHHNYDALIMGSSKAAHIRPANIKYNGKILNASFSAALPEEILAYLKEYNPKVEWIAIGLDWYMFHEKKFPYKKQPTFRKSDLEILHYTMSLDTLIYSIKSIIKTINNSSYIYTKNGARDKSENRERENSSRKGRGFDEVTRQLKRRFDGYETSNKRLSIISEIQEYGEKNSIKIIWWINPYHQEVLSILFSKNNQEIDNFPNIIKKKAKHLIDLSEKYTEADNYWINDPYHYYPETGERFFNSEILPSIFHETRQ